MIGILDSGLGGLSVLNEIQALLPQEPLIYIGDSAFCPYGTKAPAEIIQRTRKLSQWLIDQGAKLIVIACNSATIAAIAALRAEFCVPFVGMEPGVKPACAVSKSKVIGILATEASLAGEKFHRLVCDHATTAVKVITRPCPRFVELVEAGQLDGAEAEAAVREAVAPMLAEGADTLVLGCTHYPFLSPLIQATAGPEVSLIDTGPAVARQVKHVLESHQLSSSERSPTHRLYTSGSVALMSRLLPKLAPAITSKPAPLPS